MNWYLPITIIPGLGMLILSTTSQMMNLSSEIGKLLSVKCSVYQHEISKRKIKQLGLLTRASALLYLATGCYVLSGILGVVFENTMMLDIPSIALYIGTIFIFIAITFLITYAFKAVKIRKDQFNNNQVFEIE
jgi:protein-S-isoprenylcysteine O-methyltransferase Ste14